VDFWVGLPQALLTRLRRSTIFSGHTANDNINYGGNGISATDHANAYPGAFDVTLNTDSTAATQHKNYLGEANSFQGQPLSTAFPYIFFCGMLMSQWSFTGCANTRGLW